MAKLCSKIKNTFVKCTQIIEKKFWECIKENNNVKYSTDVDFPYMYTCTYFKMRITESICNHQGTSYIFYAKKTSTDNHVSQFKKGFKLKNVEK